MAAKKDVRVEICPVCETGVKINSLDGPDALQRAMEEHMATQTCADAAAARFAAKKRSKCPVPGCKEKLTQSGSIECGTCKQRVCLKHRFEDAHQCKAADCRSAGACGREALQ